MALYPPIGPGALGIVTGDDPLQDRELQRILAQYPILGTPPPGIEGVGSNPLMPEGIEPEAGSADIKRPGFFGRIKQQPGGSRALMALGASLLSNQNFFQGLGKGGMAYQSVLDQEADKLKPKLTKDGNFTYTLDPQTGEPVFKRTAAADFEERQNLNKLDAADKLGRYRTDVASGDKRFGIETEYGYKDKRLGYEDRWQDNDNKSAERIAALNAAAAERRARISAATAAGKPVASGVLRTYEEKEGAANAAAGALQIGSKVLSHLENGTLELGLLANLKNKGSAVTGLGADEASRAYAEMEQFTQMLVNATLLDAKGVQTDGDAIRAKIMSRVSAGDNQGAAQEFRNAMTMLERGRSYNEARADDISRQYGIQTEATQAVVGRNNTGSSRSSLKSKYGLE